MTNDNENLNYISGKTGDWEIVIGLETVSYTHLTLPTSDLV